MVGIIGSLLVVIFSFSFGLVIGAMVLNGGLYVVLLKLSNEPQLLNRTNVLPKAISNKKTSALCYEDKS
ncbi:MULTISPECIES: hypothetical protein [unclassified Croceitalea]|uniref:hypothetical protein n=1 Tax=unclassified Croceitalea TaxID=2632280 RepID=UPI0030D7E773